MQEIFVERRKAGKAASAYADIDVQLALITFDGLLPVMILSTLGQVGTTILVAWHYGDRWLWVLSAVMLVVGLCRLSVVVAFEGNKSGLVQVSAARWQNAYAVSTIPYCAALALSTFYNFGHHDLTAQGLCTIGTFSLCAGLSARLGLRPWAGQASGLMLLTTLGFCVLQSPERLLAYNGTALICMFAVAHCKSMRDKFNAVVDQLRIQNTLKEMAERDVLTGVANRRYFQERLSALCAGPGEFAVLFLDLDRFKVVNDTHGHSVGDALLVQVADRLKAEIRSTDLLARFGGDEFAILEVPFGSAESVKSLASRINRTLSLPFKIEKLELSIGTSIGIALSWGAIRDANRILRAADAALYHVKNTERGGYSFATE